MSKRGICTHTHGKKNQITWSNIFMQNWMLISYKERHLQNFIKPHQMTCCLDLWILWLILSYKRPPLILISSCNRQTYFFRGGRLSAISYVTEKGGILFCTCWTVPKPSGQTDGLWKMFAQYCKFLLLNLWTVIALLMVNVPYCTSHVIEN